MSDLRVPQLRINYLVNSEVAGILTAILMDCPDGPTFAVVRETDGWVRLWLSKRTFEYLRAQLSERKMAMMEG
jgi:hypothetical protein